MSPATRWAGSHSATHPTTTIAWEIPAISAAVLALSSAVETTIVIRKIATPAQTVIRSRRFSGFA